MSSKTSAQRFEHYDSASNHGHYIRRDSVASMTKNTSGEIRNPLVGIPKDTLMRDVEDYAHQHDLVQAVDLLKRGALVAQDPDHIEHIEGITPEETTALKEEKTHRWRHPKTLYFLITLGSIGAAIQGWDQTGSNGANLSFPQEFGIADTGPVCTAAGTCQRNSWIIGAINSMPYMTIALL